MNITFRTAAVATALAFSGVAAHSATLMSLSFAATQSNSVQKFSEITMIGFESLNLTVTPKGTTTAVAGTTDSYAFPVTKVSIGTKLNIASGSSSGAALLISGRARGADGQPVAVSVTLANFTINYETKQVLADTTPLGGTVIPQMPLYNFTVDTKLALKYSFPLRVTGHEVLSNLLLTPEAKAAFRAGLRLTAIADNALEQDFGTLTQDISTQARKPATPTAPYVAQ